MCLRPKTIITRSRVISTQGGQPFLMNVPCGHCAECDETKADEYYLRSYYQAKKTFDSGGYIMLDTLTYKDECLPHVSDEFPIFKDTLFDFPCFSRRHVRLFFVTLRQKLARAGYHVSESLKYFLSSEYGTSSVGTHRPHYHIILYITCDIQPEILSRFISESWPYGRTDGIPYKPSLYVLSHNTITAESGQASALKASCYVSKYVVKSSAFERVVTSRVNGICELLRSKLASCNKDINPDEFFQLSEIAKDPKSFRREVSHLCCQFHRQSQGFGLSALDDIEHNCIDSIFDSNSLACPCTDGVVKHVPLPTYYARKLFYELTEDFRGVKTWKLTDFGKQFKLCQFEKSIDNLTIRFKDVRSNMSPVYASAFDILIPDDKRLSEFALYVALFKGRVCFRRDYQDHSIDTWISSIFYDSPCVWSPIISKRYYNYLTCNLGTGILDEPCITNRYLGDSKTGWIYPPQDGDYKGYMPINKDVFLSFFVIDESFDPAFKGFDEAYNIIINSMSNINKQKQAAYDLKQRQKQLNKQLQTFS